MSKRSAHKLMLKNESVHNQIISSTMQQIKKNRTYMMQLIEITLHLSKQGIAFRGHRENELSLNGGLYLLKCWNTLISKFKNILGNFKETCSMVAKFNETFASHFYSKTNHSNWSVQNTIKNN